MAATRVSAGRTVLRSRKGWARRCSGAERFAEVANLRRLSQHVVDVWRWAFLVDETLSPAGQQNNGQARCERLDAGGDLESIDVRHPQVRDDDIERSWAGACGGKFVDPFSAAAGQPYTVAVTFQDVAQRLPQGRVVVHDEYAQRR